MVAAAQARRGTVTVSEILNLAQQRVDDGVIINHIRSHGGMAAPLSAQDLVALKQYGVNPQVVRVMQETPPPVVAAPGVYIADPGPPPPVVVGGVYYGHPGYWGPRHRHCW